jgi:hypothetical protein
MFRLFLDDRNVAIEDQVIRRIALRGFASDGISLARADGAFDTFSRPQIASAELLCEKTVSFLRYLEMLRPPFTVARNTFGSNGTFFSWVFITGALCDAPRP